MSHSRDKIYFLHNTNNPKSYRSGLSLTKMIVTIKNLLHG